MALTFTRGHGVMGKLELVQWMSDFAVELYEETPMFVKVDFVREMTQKSLEYESFKNLLFLLKTNAEYVEDHL